MVTEARELYRDHGAVQILQKFRSNTTGAVSCLALILQACRTFDILLCDTLGHKMFWTLSQIATDRNIQHILVMTIADIK